MAIGTGRDASPVVGAFEHALWDESGEFGDFFVDVVSPSPLDGIVALSSSSSFFVCDEGLFVLGRDGVCGWGMGVGVGARRRGCGRSGRRGRDGIRTKGTYCGGGSGTPWLVYGGGLDGETGGEGTCERVGVVEEGDGGGGGVGVGGGRGRGVAVESEINRIVFLRLIWDRKGGVGERF